MKRPIPDDFLERVSELKTVSAVTRHYGMAKKTIQRFFKEAGLKPIADRKSWNTKPIPSDFEIMAKVMTNRELARHYDVNHSVVSRWIAELGIKSNRTELRKPAPKQPARHKWVMPPPPAKRDDRYDLAAEYLRRLMPVHRSGPTGRYEQSGDYYRVGAVVMTPDEMAAHAEWHKEKAMRRIFDSVY